MMMSEIIENFDLKSSRKDVDNPNKLAVRK